MRNSKILKTTPVGRYQVKSKSPATSGPTFSATLATVSVGLVDKNCVRSISVVEGGELDEADEISATGVVGDATVVADETKGSFDDALEKAAADVDKNDLSIDLLLLTKQFE